MIPTGGEASPIMANALEGAPPTPPSPLESAPPDPPKVPAGASEAFEPGNPGTSDGWNPEPAIPGAANEVDGAIADDVPTGVPPVKVEGRGGNPPGDCGEAWATAASVGGGRSPWVSRTDPSPARTAGGMPKSQSAASAARRVLGFGRIEVSRSVGWLGIMMARRIAIGSPIPDVAGPEGLADDKSGGIAPNLSAARMSRHKPIA